MSFGKQAQELISDPEVYRLFDAVAAKVDAIVELMAEKRRSAVAILKDYTDGLMETMEGQLKPAAEMEGDSSSDYTTDGEDFTDEEKESVKKFTTEQQLDCNLFTTAATD